MRWRTRFVAPTVAGVVVPRRLGCRHAPAQASSPAAAAGHLDAAARCAGGWRGKLLVELRRVTDSRGDSQCTLHLSPPLSLPSHPCLSGSRTAAHEQGGSRDDARVGGASAMRRRHLFALLGAPQLRVRSRLLRPRLCCDHVCCCDHGCWCDHGCCDHGCCDCTALAATTAAVWPRWAESQADLCPRLSVGSPKRI